MNPLYGNELNEFYVRKVRHNFAERSARLAAVRTKEDARAYVAELKEKVRSIFQFPEKTPLNARTAVCRKKQGYTLENIVFESRPGYPVTANLYLPENGCAKHPGVLILCGHSSLGKCGPTYRAAALGLVRKGFAVLVPDPVEQGERKQYLDYPEIRDRLCGNHNMAGKQLALVGEWFGAWRTWDAIRALDYMESRSEIDASMLSVTGNSGGGTLTTMLAAVDPRPVAVAPSCYITSWKHNVENELPADMEQMPPMALALGLEMGDFLLAQAPKKLLILGQKNDFFDPRGVKETAEEIGRINALLGGETDYFIGPHGHGFHVENRKAVYRFFTRNFFGEENDDEPAEEQLPDEEFFAAAGNVRTIPGNTPLHELILRKAEEFAAARKAHTLPELREILTQLLKLDKTFLPYHRVLRWRRTGNGTVASRFALETEEGALMCVLSRFSADGWFHIAPEPRKITLYVPHQDSFDELKARPVQEEFPLYALDVRGIGQMMPSGTDQPEPRDFFHPYQFDYHYAALATMFGKTELGGRVHDILCAVELLSAQGAEVALEGSGLGAIPALMAAVLSDKITSLKLTNALDSFDSVVRNDVTDLPFSCVLPGVLAETDLPELRGAIREKLR